MSILNYLIAMKIKSDKPLPIWKRIQFPSQEHLMVKVIKLKSCDEEIDEKNISVQLKFCFPTIINIQFKIRFQLSFCSSMMNIFPTKTLKTMCLLSNISLPSLSKWVVRKTHDKETKHRGGCFESFIMETVTIMNLIF